MVVSDAHHDSGRQRRPLRRGTAVAEQREKRASHPVILLVDDNRIFLELEKEFLGELDVSIMTAADGWEALQIMASVRPALVFMDLHMPVMDGAASCASMKSDPRLRTIPVVMVSSIDQEGDAERCRAAGCDGILEKPVTKKALVASARQFLQTDLPFSQRVACRTQVVFWTADRCSYGMSEDLGPDGIYIAFKEKVVEKESVQLYFLLPGMPEGLVEATGSIVWVNRGRSASDPARPDGFGVEFHKMSEECRRLIGTYLASASTP
jgi:CheY-like chemotaxis protein